MNNKTIMAQGDLLFISVDNIPDSLSQLVRQNGSNLVLAEGEITGNAHTIKNQNIQAWKGDKNSVWLNVEEALAEVEHQEHDSVELPRGKYKVIRQHEYVTPKIEKRQVSD